jgi:hypothetical protein
MSDHINERAAAAALLVLAEHGIESDVQELLLRGSLRRGVRPGALAAAMAAACAVYREDRAALLPYVKKDLER